MRASVAPPVPRLPAASRGDEGCNPLLPPPLPPPALQCEADPETLEYSQKFLTKIRDDILVKEGVSQPTSKQAGHSVNCLDVKRLPLTRATSWSRRE